MDTQGTRSAVSATEEQELRVANSTDVRYLATAMLRYLDEGKKLYLACIGVQAINQACKSVAVSNGELAPQGFVLMMLPTFQLKKFQLDGEDVERTVMRFALHRHKIGF